MTTLPIFPLHQSVKKAIVVLSGGMDSATLLAVAVDCLGRKNVYALTIDYGQRHWCEIDKACQLAAHYGVEHRVVNISGVAAVMGANSQTDRHVEVPHGHYEEESMKLTVVPNRNMLLLSIAATYAISVQTDTVLYGAHAGDHAIYPDCRPEFVRAMRDALLLCDYSQLNLMAPFMSLDKGNIVSVGLQLSVPYEDTWTCYEGKTSNVFSCGQCGACQERLEAFAKAGAVDPIKYVGQDTADWKFVTLKGVCRDICRVPPDGWTCTRDPGHDGPCAAIEDLNRELPGHPDSHGVPGGKR